MTTFLLTLVIFGVLLALLGIRILIEKNGEFKGTCSSAGKKLHEMHGIECYGGCTKEQRDQCDKLSKEHGHPC
mgnify:FL=1